jgi:antitoxin component of MazEF toxin-antitoxin module
MSKDFEPFIVKDKKIKNTGGHSKGISIPQRDLNEANLEIGDKIDCYVAPEGKLDEPAEALKKLEKLKDVLELSKETIEEVLK